MKSETIFNSLNEDKVWEHIEENYPKLLDMPIKDEDSEIEGPTYKTIRIKGINYRINYINNTAEVIGRIDDSYIVGLFGDTLEIPEKIEQDGKSFTVTSIGKGALKELQLENIKLPETIRTIGAGAFENSRLRTIDLPEGLTKLEDNIFSGCSFLVRVYVPKNVTTFGKNVFKNHGAILFIFGYIKSAAEEYAKENNIEFIAVDDPEGKGDCVVDGLIYKLNKTDKTATIVGMKSKLILEILGQLDHLRIFNDIEFEGTRYQVKTIGKDALKGGQFSKVFIDFGIETIESGAFTECNYLTKFSTGSGIKTIKKGAFTECVSLTEVNISENIKKLDFEAFIDCNNLRKITISSENKNYILENTKTYDRGMIDYGGVLHDDITNEYFYSMEGNGILYDKDKKILYGCIVSSYLPYINGDYKTSYLAVPDSVTEIKEKAFDKCLYYEDIKVYIGVNVNKIADNAFDSIKDRLIIRGYTNSYAEEYAKKHNIIFESIGLAQEGIHDITGKFVFGKDNYDFINGWPYFTSYDIGDIKNYLSNSLLVNALKNEEKKWSGSCGGMATTTLMFKYGYLTPDFWKAVYETEEITCQNDLGTPIRNEKLRWLINFYWMFFWESGFANDNEILNKKDDNIIKGFYDGLVDYCNNLDYQNTNTTLICTFYWYENADEDDEDDEDNVIIYDDGITKKIMGHAINIVGAPEELDEKFYAERGLEFLRYKYRIPIYDPNSSEPRYIYIPGSFSEIRFGTDKMLGILDILGFDKKLDELKSITTYKLTPEKGFNIEQAIKSGEKIKFLHLDTIRYNPNVAVKISNAENEYASIQNMEQIEGTLECSINPIIGITADEEKSGNTHGITDADIILKPEDLYSFETLNDTDPLEASILFGDSYMTAKTTAGGKAIFENKKSVTLTNPSGKDYEISLTLNDEFMTLPWYTITATGTDAKDIKLEMVPEGVIVSGDNLKNLKIKGNNTEETVELNINTDKNKVLITANNDETKLIAFIDTDGDGTYETPLNPEEAENKDNEEGNKKDDANKENDSKDSNKNNKKEENNNQINGVKAGDEIIYALLLLVAGTIILTIVEIIKHLFN